MDYGILSLIPVTVTLLMVFTMKNVFLALLSGILSATILIGVSIGDFLIGIQSMADVFSDSSTTMTTFFVLLTGGLMCVANRSGGVEGLVNFCTQKHKIVKSPVGAQLLSFVLGLLMFVDATSSIAVTAIVGKPFFKKYAVPSEKLALNSNSTGSAIAWLIPFGGACAILTTFFAPVARELGLSGEPFAIVISSIPYQFYTITLLTLLLTSILFRFDLGKIQRKKDSHWDTSDYSFETAIMDCSKVQARNMLIPLFTLVGLVFSVLLMTGNGSISAGNGSLAVFTAGVLTLIFTGIWFWIRKVVPLKEYTSWCIDGMKNMYEMAMILVLAYTLGSLLSVLGTAAFLSKYVQMMPSAFMLCMAFLITTLIAYATGTSGGTIAVLVPILVPIIVPMEIDAPFLLGAIVSGAVFGDQNSPISDSVILTSSMTGVDIMDHVKTQMPYTFLAWVVAFVGYFILGLIGG